MAKTYNSNLSGVGDEITVQSGGTVEITGDAFNPVVGIVGGMDTNNGSSSPGTVESPSSVSEAENLFGSGSELAYQVDLAYQNQAQEVFAVGVPETTGVTDSFSATSSGTLSNVPAFDPNVNTEHDITAQDTAAASSVDVTIVYDKSPSAPSSGINLNPVNGKWTAASSSDYDITYDYGSYQTAIGDVAKEDISILIPCTEDDGIINTAVSEANSHDDDFDFFSVVAGEMPEVDAASYTNNDDEWRLSIVVPSRGYDTDDNEMRTAGAVGAKFASKDLDDTVTFESISGFDTFRTTYTNSQLGSLNDQGVVPLRESDMKVIRDNTTSDDVRFERVYAVRIIDEATLRSHQIAEQFIGELNTAENRGELKQSHLVQYGDMQEDNLLDAYSVNVSEGANADEVDVEIGLNVVDVMDIVDITISVGEVVTSQVA